MVAISVLERKVVKAGDPRKVAQFGLHYTLKTLGYENTWSRGGVGWRACLVDSDESDILQVTNCMMTLGVVSATSLWTFQILALVKLPLSLCTAFGSGLSKSCRLSFIYPQKCDCFELYVNCQNLTEIPPLNTGINVTEVTDLTFEVSPAVTFGKQCGFSAKTHNLN